MAMTDAAVRGAKPREKAYRIRDTRGLYLEVTPAGRKHWRFRYKTDGKESMLSLGSYPDVTLLDARQKALELRKGLKAGVNPSAARKAEAEAARGGDSFEAVAREWVAKFSRGWSEGHTETIVSRLQMNVYPYIGTARIKDVTAPELLAVVRRIEARGALEVARRVLQICGQVFRYAVATGRAERDPSGDLRGALPPTPQKHHAALTEPKAVGALLRAIDGFTGSIVVKCAMQLAPLTFVRPGELRRAEWTEFDFDAAEWRIPAAKMKMKTEHVVPLSRQALEVLRTIQRITGGERYVFPSIRTLVRPMSENTVNAALRRLGYQSDEMTGHGFRTMASTLLNEQGWSSDAIERQLAHVERNRVRAAYNAARYMQERRKMMQAWADYLDALRSGARIIPLHEMSA